MEFMAVVAAGVEKVGDSLYLILQAVSLNGLGPRRCRFSLSGFRLLIITFIAYNLIKTTIVSIQQPQTRFVLVLFWLPDLMKGCVFGWRFSDMCFRHVQSYSFCWEKLLPFMVYVAKFSVLFLAGEGRPGQFVPVVFMMILARSCTCLGVTHIFPVTSLFKLGYVYISSSAKERIITTTSLEWVHKSPTFKAAINVLLPVMAEEFEIDLLAIDSETFLKKLPVFVYDSNRLPYLMKSILTHPVFLLDSLSISFFVILFYLFIAFNRCIL